MVYKYVAWLIEALIVYNTTTRFLLARFYIDLLLDKNTIKGVKLALKRFSRGSKDSKIFK